MLDQDRTKNILVRRISRFPFVLNERPIESITMPNRASSVNCKEYIKDVKQFEDAE